MCEIVNSSRLNHTELNKQVKIKLFLILPSVHDHQVLAPSILLPLKSTEPESRHTRSTPRNSMQHKFHTHQRYAPSKSVFNLSFIFPYVNLRLKLSTTLHEIYYFGEIKKDSIIPTFDFYHQMSQ